MKTSIIMKKLYLIVIFSYIQVNLNICGLLAQDVIYKSDGTEIQSKVMEITEDLVKFKFWDQQDGPLRNISISDVFMIIYEDGTTENFQNFRNPEVSEKKPSDSNMETKEYLAVSDLKEYELQLSQKKLKYSRYGNIEIYGDLNWLKNENNFLLKYDYTDISIGGMDEENYISKRIAEHEEKDPGSGATWRMRWFADRESVFEPNFEVMLNKYINEKEKYAGVEIGQSRYTFLIHTSFLEPGYHAGVTSSAAWINVEIYIIASHNNECLAKIAMKKVKRNLTAYDAASRIGIAYTGLGKQLGKFLVDEVF